MDNQGLGASIEEARFRLEETLPLSLESLVLLHLPPVVALNVSIQQEGAAREDSGPSITHPLYHMLLTFFVAGLDETANIDRIADVHHVLLSHC